MTAPHEWQPDLHMGYSTDKRPWTVARPCRGAWGGMERAIAKGGDIRRFATEAAAKAAADKLNAATLPDSGEGDGNG